MYIKRFCYSVIGAFLLSSCNIIGGKDEVEVSESSDEFRIGTETENQLDFAIKLLNG